MWYFISSENPDHRYVILGGKVYTVGRKDCDILVIADATVSRKHAEISMSHAEVNLANVSRLPILLLKDVSKFGTYVNNQRVSGERILQDGDSVHFGSPKTPFMVVFEPLVLTTSCLDTASKKAVRKQLCLLGGHMISEWNSHCSLLVMSRLSVTVKVICALVSQNPVVTPDYLSAFLTYQQGKADKPSPDIHTPVLAETQLDPNEASFLPDSRRKTVFQGMTFVFLNDKQMKKLCQAIQLGGGTPLLIEEGGDDDMLCEPGTVVMGTADIELSQAGGEWFKHVQDVLQRNGKHMITDAEVGFAVLYCSTEKHCNPDYEPDKSISKLPSQSLSQAEMFVANTETQHGSQDTQSVRLRKQNASQQVVNETVLGPKQSATRSKKAGSPEDSVVTVKQEPISQTTPLKNARKRGRDDEKDDHTAVSVKKKVKAEPVTPVSKPVASTSAARRPAATEDWGSDDDELDYSTIDVSPATTSRQLRDAKKEKQDYVATSAQKTKSRSRSPGNVTDLNTRDSRSRSSRKIITDESADGPSTRSRSRSPARFDDLSTVNSKTRSRSPAKVSGPKPTSSSTRSRSRSPATKDDELVPKSRSSRRTLDKKTVASKSVSPSRKGRSRSRSPHTAVDPESDDPPAEGESSSRSRSKKQVRQAEEYQLSEVKEEVEQMEITPAGPVPEGFLSTRNNQQMEIKKQEITETDDELPSNCATIDIVSLVVRKPKPPVSAAGACPEGHQRWKGKFVKNFKKFRKTGNAGSHRLPTIIGGSDLDVHQGQRSKELDDWFKESVQAESQNANEESRASALFDYEPSARKRGR